MFYWISSRDRTAKTQLLSNIITESEFAYDAALYATSDENFMSLARSFVKIAGH